MRKGTVLIISIASDSSTHLVCKWLSYFKQKYVVVTPDVPVNIISLNSEKELLLCIDGLLINSNEIKSSWYRRDEIRIKPYLIDTPTDITNKQKSLYRGANYFIGSDYGRIVSYLYHWLASKPHLDTIFTSDLNKLLVLDKAQAVGLNIPPWAIYSSKAEVEKFKQVHNSIITKPVAGGGYFETDSHYIQVYTEEADDELISNLSDEFAPSFFQKKIDKEFEIRAYLLNDKFYSMAIFSQQNEQTALDFRHYDKERPNRNVPFKLPADLEEKLLELAKLFKMNSCSFDLIYGIDKEYHFLEVNPVGQFGMTSFPCNYNVEKQIAEFLSAN